MSITYSEYVSVALVIQYAQRKALYYTYIVWYVIPTTCTCHRVFLFNLVTALLVSVVVTTHPQEHKATASTKSGKHYTVLLFAAIVEKLVLSNFSTTAVHNSTV